MPTPTRQSEPSRSERPSPASGRRRAARAIPSGADTLGPAFVLTVLFHLLLFKGVESSALFVTAPAGTLASGKTPESMPVRIAPENTPVPANLLPPSMRPTPPKFVEINPLAPSLKPDKTNNTGAADQRAAQRDPDPLSASERPRMKGEEPDSTRITQGIPRDFLPEHLKPAPGQPLGKPAPPKPQPEAPAKAADGPDARPALPAGKPLAAAGVPFSEKTGAAKPDSAATSDKKPDAPTPEKRDGAKSGADTGKAAKPAETKPEAKPAVSVESAQPAEPAPRPRPRATLAGTAGPLGISLASAPDRGALDAQNSVFSRMGEYASRMFEIIQANWWAAVDRSRVSERGTVVIEFTLHKDGSVSDARIVSRTTSERAAYLCLDAVTGRAPFDAWPEDMVAMFGEKQEGRLTFHYR